MVSGKAQWKFFQAIFWMTRRSLHERRFMTSSPSLISEEAPSLPNLHTVLSSRTLIHQVSSSHEAFHNHMSTPRSLYLGMDPTAKSLHIGHFIQIITLTHCATSWPSCQLASWRCHSLHR